MAMSRAEFVIKTLILCTVLFSMTTMAHTLGLMIKGEVEQVNPSDYHYQFGSKDQPKYNESNPNADSKAGDFDILDVLTGIGALLLGIDLPMPFPIVVTAWNGIMITMIVFCIAEIIRMWFWGMPAG